MFKQAAYAAVAAAAFTAVPASAAIIVSYPIGQNIILPGGPVIFSGAFTGRVQGTGTVAQNGAFTATYTFNFANMGRASASAVNVELTPGSNIDFTSAFLNTTAGMVVNDGIMSTAWAFNVPVGVGTHTLTISGVLNPNGGPGRPIGTGDATFGGTLTLTAVPEPATWALFILGFGALGHTMRRRSNKVRIAKASLNFA